jgi:hypothetical protein
MRGKRRIKEKGEKLQNWDGTLGMRNPLVPLAS